MAASPTVVDLSAPEKPGRAKLYAQLASFDDQNCTYFLCPDRKCKLFEKPDCRVPCDRECPLKAEKVIVCHSCKRPIVLPASHSSFCRVDCECGASNFQRMSGRYRRHNVSVTKARA